MTALLRPWPPRKRPRHHRAPALSPGYRFPPNYTTRAIRSAGLIAVNSKALAPSKQLEHHEWARGLGFIDAIAVPIHHPGGDLGLCACIADHAVDDTFERHALQMASLFAYQRCRELGGQSKTSSAQMLLTPREAECLRWVLKAKSDSDIGKILGISATTVHFHIEREKKKLGVKTRKQAAAAVVSMGYL